MFSGVFDLLEIPSHPHNVITVRPRGKYFAGVTAMSTYIHTRIDRDLKQQARRVFQTLGILPSEAIRLFLRQVVLTGGIPFPLVAPKVTIDQVDELDEDDDDGCDPEVEVRPVSTEWAQREREVAVRLKAEQKKWADILDAMGIVPKKPSRRRV